MKNPGWFFGFLKMLNRLKLVNSSIFKFVDHYIGNQRVREALYQRWTGLRKFKPLKKQTRALLEKNKTSLQLLYGKYDRIITPPAGEEFCKGIKSPCTITIIDAGHQLLNEKHSPGIITALVN
jgi:pimeloyl-ACP methyl ester carboxylesterase